MVLEKNAAVVKDCCGAYRSILLFLQLFADLFSAIAAESEVDDESFSWAVSILALGYLAVPLLFISVLHLSSHLF